MSFDRRLLVDRINRPLRGSAPGYSLVEMIAFLALIVTMGAFILPFTRTTLEALNLSGDARSLSSAVSLAKMRAAADFSQARLRVNLGAETYVVERWKKTPTPGWVSEGAVSNLSSSTSFGFGGITAPPPNTQATIAQAPPCLDAALAAIADTACVVFNSRGIPVDATGAPIANDALYLSDGSVVFSVTASAGGLVRLWRANAADGVWALH